MGNRKQDSLTFAPILDEVSKPAQGHHNKKTTKTRLRNRKGQIKVGNNKRRNAIKRELREKRETEGGVGPVFQNS